MLKIEAFLTCENYGQALCWITLPLSGNSISCITLMLTSVDLKVLSVSCHERTACQTAVHFHTHYFISCTEKPGRYSYLYLFLEDSSGQQSKNLPVVLQCMNGARPYINCYIDFT